MLRSPVARKRSSADSGEVESAEKVRTKGDEAVDEILAHGTRRSRGPRALAALGSSFQQDKHAAETLGANGAGAYLGGDRARVDPQARWRLRAPCTRSSRFTLGLQVPMGPSWEVLT